VWKYKGRWIEATLVKKALKMSAITALVTGSFLHNIWHEEKSIKLAGMLSHQLMAAAAALVKQLSTCKKN
jgi:hypothetical protein